MAYSIYRIRNCVTGKSYVGRTVNFKRRCHAHLQQLNNGTHYNLQLQHAWSSGSPNDFVFEVVQTVDTLAEAISAEQELIDAGIGKTLYNVSQANFGDALTHNPNRSQVIEKIKVGVHRAIDAMSVDEKREKYASHPNGMLGRTHTSEARARIAAANSGNQYALGSVRSTAQRENMSRLASLRVGDKNPFYGKVHSSETREAIARANAGRIPSNTTAVVIYGQVFDSMAAASRALGVPVPTIHYRVNSDRKKWCEYKYK